MCIGKSLKTNNWCGSLQLVISPDCIVSEAKDIRSVVLKSINENTLLEARIEQLFYFEKKAALFCLLHLFVLSCIEADCHDIKCK